MDVPQARPRIWSPKIIVFSVVLHVVVLYYIASAFNIVPPIIPVDEPPTIPTITLPPTPPDIDPEPVNIKKPPFPIRQPKVPPVAPTVDPVPVPPTVPVADGPPSIVAVNQPLAEQPVEKPLPFYPQIALAKEIEGRVRLSITIMPDGTVRDVTVVSAKPRGYFEEAAMRAVRNWRYRPSKVIRTNVIVDIDFVLKG